MQLKSRPFAMKTLCLFLLVTSVAVADDIPPLGVYAIFDKEGNPTGEVVKVEEGYYESERYYVVRDERDTVVAVGTITKSGDYLAYSGWKFCSGEYAMIAGVLVQASSSPETYTWEDTNGSNPNCSGSGSMVLIE